MRHLIVGVLSAPLLAACGATSGTQPTPTTQSPSASSTATASPTATPVPTPTGAPPGFACSDVAGGSAQAGSSVVDVSVGQHPGYDRLVIQFSGAIPGYLVTRQQSAAFILSPKGTPVTLEGSAGVHVVINPVLDWTSYHGPTSFHPRYPFIRQALMLENFEGYQQWGLGVQGTPCLKVFTLGAPSRLVIDVASG